MNLNWRMDQRLSAAGLPHTDPRSAFRAGYADAFYGYSLWASNERDFYPAAYKAGYTAGRADRLASEVPQ